MSAGLRERLDGRLRGLLVATVVLGVSGVILAALAVLPARTWLAQRQERAEVEAELERIEAEVDQLEVVLQLLETDAEIERRARENFDLVFPGEESYRILEPAEG